MWEFTSKYQRVLESYSLRRKFHISIVVPHFCARLLGPASLSIPSMLDKVGSAGVITWTCPIVYSKMQTAPAYMELFGVFYAKLQYPATKILREKWPQEKRGTWAKLATRLRKRGTTSKPTTPNKAHLSASPIKYFSVRADGLLYDSGVLTNHYNMFSILNIII